MSRPRGWYVVAGGRPTYKGPHEERTRLVGHTKIPPHAPMPTMNTNPDPLFMLLVLLFGNHLSTLGEGA